MEHYCTIGWREGRKPSPTFDDSQHCVPNPAVLEGQFCPLVHFALASLSTTIANEQRLNADIMLVQPFIDKTAYLTRNPDVAESGMEPVRHFCQYGWREGRNPNINFDVTSYLKKQPALVELGFNPFIHFILSSGRKSDNNEAGIGQKQLHPSMRSVIDVLTPVFDPVYYALQNLDIVDLGVDPLEHFCLYGWREGRDPSSQFSIEYYLQSNPDVVASGLNPFFHYVTQGRFEGRAARHPGGDAYDSLQSQTPLEDMVTNWRQSAKKPSHVITLADLKAQLEARKCPLKTSLMIAVGHDDYLSNSGGVQLCIQQEMKRAKDYHTTYLNIHPACPLPRLVHAEEDADPTVILVLDGERLGACRISDLIAAVSSIRSAFTSAHVVIHHLMGQRLCRILCPGAFRYAIGKRSSNMIANWLLTACHSRTERFHS